MTDAASASSNTLTLPACGWAPPSPTRVGEGKIGIAIALLGASLLSACSVGPDYQRPAVDVPTRYKEQDGWKPVQPQDAAERGPWWTVYGDPQLDSLERQVDVSNQTLKAAVAAYAQASALADVARAGLYPTATVTGSGQRSQVGESSFGRTSGATIKPRITNQFTTSLGASWEPDVWGRVGRLVEGDVASAQASAADLASARLSAQSTLAKDYFALRAADEQKRLLDRSAQAYAESLRITHNQYASGVASRADVVEAETQLASTQAQAIAVGVQRAQFEHAIAVLVGKAPAEFAVAPVESLPDAPAVPAGLPSALLERRPDIAAAERRMAATNATMGVAQAAFYPTLNLSGSLGFAGGALGSLLQASNNIWSVGPQLAATLFDGGARRAQVAEAEASYDQTVANYRQTVLTGFQQVEDQLAALRILAQQATVQDQAVRAAEEAEKLVLNQYKAGTVAYTSVITAQTAALANKQTALAIKQNRLAASVGLIEAVGGGWDASQLPKTVTAQ